MDVASVLAEAEIRLRREGLPVNELTQLRTLASANVLALQAELGARVEDVFPALFASDYGSTSPQAWRGGSYGGRRFAVAPGAAAEWGPFGWLPFKQPAEWSPALATNPAALEAVAPAAVQNGAIAASAPHRVAGLLEAYGPKPGTLLVGAAILATLFLLWRRS